MHKVPPPAGRNFQYLFRICRGLFFSAVFLLLSYSLYAQDDEVQMADGLRSSGKIYVVVAVLLTVFVGLILYLIRLDRKISRLEKEKTD